MSKLKLMSALQSRIAKRRTEINKLWQQSIETYPEDRHYYREFAIEEGIEQKHDKLILKQLVEDERKLKLLRECAKKLQGRIDTLLGWNK